MLEGNVERLQRDKRDLEDDRGRLNAKLVLKDVETSRLVTMEIANEVCVFTIADFGYKTAEPRKRGRGRREEREREEG